jgi:hypothetical protein
MIGFILLIAIAYLDIGQFELTNLSFTTAS